MCVGRKLAACCALFAAPLCVCVLPTAQACSKAWQSWVGVTHGGREVPKCVLMCVRPSHRGWLLCGVRVVSDM